TIDNLTSLLSKHENEGWIGTENKEIFKPLVATLRERKGLTILEKVKGHAGIEGNEGADRLANEGAKSQNPTNINLEITEAYEVLGAKLASITQALAYKSILESQLAPEQKGTITHLDMTRWATKERTGDLPQDITIWKSLRSKHLTRDIRNFLWKCMHNTYKLGKYWENIPDCSERATCPRCRIEESLDHILTECEVSGQEEVWTMVRTIFEKNGADSTKPSLGDILGCAIEMKIGHLGPKRFRIIIMSEAAHTIWKARCEWRIGRGSDPEQTLSKKEISMKLKTALSQRIKLDCLATDTERFGKRAVETGLVRETWKHLLPEGSTPSRAWRKITAVLVGIG
ncbi:hypothetical protein J132_09038, partial [Termitomyces sp. J132]